MKTKLLDIKQKVKQQIKQKQEMTPFSDHACEFLDAYVSEVYVQQLSQIKCYVSQEYVFKESKSKCDITNKMKRF